MSMGSRSLPPATAEQKRRWEPTWKKIVHGPERPADLKGGRVAKECAQCGKWFSIARCHASAHTRCSIACSLAAKAARLLSRKRQCATCGGDFIPRERQLRDGGGRYCSQKCNAAFIEAGRRAPRRRGEDHPNWSGGRKTFRQRCDLDPGLRGRLNARRRETYDPVVHKDYRQTRRARAYGCGRLPNGTTRRLLALQKHRCANCRCKLGRVWHLDHIIALAKGGKHEPHNLQALCQPCNQRKFTLDPAVFAQREGRLL